LPGDFRPHGDYRLSAAVEKIAQLTTVHPRRDIRIAVKQCATLAAAYPGAVELIVADGLGDDQAEGVAITDLGHTSASRLIRPFQGFWRAAGFLFRRRPKVLHFHDPELIPVGFVAKLLGIQVVYDVHEDVPSQISGRVSMAKSLRVVLAAGARAAEWLASRTFDAILCATPHIARRFPPRKTTVVQNFPIVAELSTASTVRYSNRPRRFVYVGVFTRLRGAAEMLGAVCRPELDSTAELKIAGSCHPESLWTDLVASGNSAGTEFLGWMGRRQVADLLASARAGLVLFHPVPNHVNAQPNKLFEYMSAGLPIIASDFPLWRELVDGFECGLLVDPRDPQAIAAAMRWILDHPNEAEAMGRRGRQAIESNLNWEQEGRSLLSVYQRIYGQAAPASVV